jgi:hypothetical protein
MRMNLLKAIHLPDFPKDQCPLLRARHRLGGHPKDPGWPEAAVPGLLISVQKHF